MSHSSSPGVSLELRNLVKRYPEGTALDGIDLEVRRGEFLTLLGPSGSGKTTALNLTAGFTEPTSGEILMDGEPIAKVRPHRRNIGVVFQHYALFPNMSVGANVAFALKRRGIGKQDIERKVHEALELVELADLADRRPKQLSGGQQQRVAFVFDPPLLLMDEPLGALDRKLRESLQRQIRRLHRELGITFVYVTHDQDEAMALSDRIAIFNDGRIEQLGTPRELYERPRTSFVARFLGESNFFEGDVERVGGQAHLRCVDGTALPVDGTSVNGDRHAAVTIRPEHLILSRERVAGPCLEGVVRESYYLGADQRFEVELPGGRSVVAVRSAAAGPPLAEGDAVCVSWEAGDVVPLVQA